MGVFNSVWQMMEPLHGEFIGLAFSLLGALALYLFRARVKLIYGRANNSRNVISVPNQESGEERRYTEIYVEKFFLQNVGRKPASNAEFVLSSFPADITVWQPRDVEIKPVGKGECFIRIPQIAPGELVTIDCVYLNQPAAFVASVKCAESMGKEVPFFTVRRFPSWFYFGMTVMLLFGIAFVLQIALKLLGA